MASQLPLGVRLRDTSVFASFYVGANAATVECLKTLSPGSGPTCVWLQGPAGSGKTHLLQAVCAQAAERQQSAAYLPLREMLVRGPEVLAGYGEWAIVTLDDAEAVAGRSDWEHELFRLHQELDERRGRLLLSAAQSARACGFRLLDLRSRLQGGLPLSLVPLADDEQIRALQLRAHLRGFELPDDTAQFMLRRLPRQMAALCAFLDELDEASLVAQRRLTLPFVRAVLAKS